MRELEEVVNAAIELGESLGIFIEMPGFEFPEIIINPVESLEKKLEYWKATYDDNLEHKHAKGIRIIDWNFADYYFIKKEGD